MLKRVAHHIAISKQNSRRRFCLFVYSLEAEMDINSEHIVCTQTESIIIQNFCQSFLSRLFPYMDDFSPGNSSSPYASNSGLWVWTQTAIFVFLGSNPQSIINNYCFLGLNPQCNVSVSGFKPTINNYWSQGLNPECNI